ncbi:MAG: DNA polymerase III subunit gamma/tau [Clostridiales bacterium]|nr:DNA polymerase III subunit gamma/tau [Clostridiales bacterium]
MAYNALYRKFRPSRFGEIIGQPHITKILLNQLRSGRVAHAYLFCGSRGTGKTSTARILARAINCLSPEDGEPCGKCSACLAKNSVDIIELDAASNSGVDDMRALIERAEFAPLELKTKVYIIDEAHMLTRNASNALLKTLEEPPAHVVFILATTEPQMLPATIVSRCQRFEFHRLRVAEMVDSMKRSLDLIGAHIDEKGLIAIARAAEGGMRDCLSIADQCLSFCGGDVSEADVMNVLGSVNSAFLIKVADAVIDSDCAAVLRFVDEVVRSGRDLGVFSTDLASHFRALLLTKLCGDCREILDCTEDMMKDYEEQAKRISKERAQRAVEELLKLQLDLKLVATPRTLLESTLISVCRPEDGEGITAVTDRMNELEKKLLKVAEDARNSAAAAAREAAKTAGADTPQKSAAKADASADEAESDDSSDDGVIEVPGAGKQADELYSMLLSALETEDPTLYFAIDTSAAHWLDGGVLHIIFDKKGSNLYHYSCEPSMRSLLNETAKKAIAPVTVELEHKKDGIVRQSAVKELFGVPIIEN